MEKIAAILVSWLIALTIFLPWLLARIGLYKRWYFAPFMPPFSWRGWIQTWPMSAFFILSPVFALTPMSDDKFMQAVAITGVCGMVCALIMVVWTPRWAKPVWQRRLEDRFSHEQISAFIVTWRKLPFSTWCEMIKTEDGMFELADYAIENQTTFVDASVRLRGQQLINAEKRGLKKKPAWLSDDELRF